FRRRPTLSRNATLTRWNAAQVKSRAEVLQKPAGLLPQIRDYGRGKLLSPHRSILWASDISGAKTIRKGSFNSTFDCRSFFDQSKGKLQHHCGGKDLSDWICNSLSGDVRGRST